MMHSEIDKYRLPNESDLSWSLRKEFIERYIGDFPEETLLSLAKVYSDVESSGCSNPVSAEPMGSVASQPEQQLKKSQDVGKKKVAESSTKEKQGTSANSGSRPSVKMKQKASATSKRKSGASSQKSSSHEAFEAALQKGDEVYEVPRKKSKLCYQECSQKKIKQKQSQKKIKENQSQKNKSCCEDFVLLCCEDSSTLHSIIPKKNIDVSLEDKSLPQNLNEETSAYEGMSESDVMSKARVIALQYSLGEKVLEINAWPANLKNNFISILQFVRKSFSWCLSTSEILHSVSKMFELKLQYCTKELPFVNNRLPVYECALKVDSVQLGKGRGSTLKKARLAAAKEVIDRLMELSREVGNLSLSYFNKSRKSVEHMNSLDQNASEIVDTNMNGENEHVECVNEFDTAPGCNKETNNISISCQNDLSQGRSDTRCEGRGQNIFKNMMQENNPTCIEDLGSGVTCGIDVNLRSRNLSASECDIAAGANTSQLENKNSPSGGKQLNFDTEVVDQNAKEAKSCEFKKLIRFSNGFCVAFGFDRDNQLLDVSRHDSLTPRSEAVATSVQEINKLDFEIIDVKSGNSHKSDRSGLHGNYNLVESESDSHMENINDKISQYSAGNKEKSLKDKINNNHLFYNANNPNMISSNNSEHCIQKTDNLFDKISNHSADKRHESHWDVKPSSRGQGATAVVHPQEVKNNSTFNTDLGVGLDIIKGTVPAQNAFNTAHFSASDPCQRNGNELVGKKVAPNHVSSKNYSSGSIDPQTIKVCNSSNQHEVPLNINGPTKLLNSNSPALCGISLPHERTNAHGVMAQSFANSFKTSLLDESAKIFGLAIQHIEKLISRAAHPASILSSLSQNFSVNITYDFRLLPNHEHECILSMDNRPLCKVYGLSQKKARLEARKCAVYKLLELAAQTDIISSDLFFYLLASYNSKVPADLKLPLGNLNHNPPLSRMGEHVDTSEVMSQKNLQDPKHSASYVCPANLLNTSIFEISSQITHSAFVAILDYSDIAELEPSHCVLQVAAELNCVQVKFPCEVIASYTGIKNIRATVKCDGYVISTATAATKRIALESASQLALDKLRRTAYTIKMKFEHFEGFVIDHKQIFRANYSKSKAHRKKAFRENVKKIIEDHSRTNPYRDLLWCSVKQKDRTMVQKVAEECQFKSYTIGGKRDHPRNVVVTKFTARDLLQHLSEKNDNTCKLRYELIPPSGQ